MTIELFNSSGFWLEVIGWVGAIEILIAYGLISANKVDGTSVKYQMLNLTGSLLLIIYSIYKQAYPSSFINLVWAFIAIFALYSYWKGRSSN
ncbi:MAG: CBU_0592 family membrane protein [Cytophagaceae bacterium]